MRADRLVRGIDVLLTMDPALGEGPLGRIRGGAVAFVGSRIAWVGRSADAPAADAVTDGEGLVGMPGLVDCHTHAVWAGDRAPEFERKLAGESYSSILESGGGILSTVLATRAASLEDLAAGGRLRLRRALAQGVTTIEVKSGYGLDPDTEVRLLRASALAADIGIEVVPTFLGAHTLPEEYRSDRAEYVRQVIDDQLPRVAGLARFVDVYIDRGAFTVDEGRAILIAGRKYGLLPKVHAEQVSYTGAAAMAAELGAVSADHLERIDDAGIEAMKRNGTVAVMLPGAMTYLRDSSPPTEKLRLAGVPMAVATDLNPGSSPVRDLWTCATLACLTMKLTISEALWGITRGGALALARPDLGALRPGNVANLSLYALPTGTTTEAALIHQMGPHAAAAVFRNGQCLAAIPAL